MVRPMVHSTKHIVQITLSTATTGATSVNTLVSAVARQDADSAIEVEEGSTVKALYLELWVIGSANDQFFTAIVAKLIGGQGNISQTDLTNLFSYDNKKNVLYTTQGLAPNDGVGQPINIYKGWIKVPKSKQRFGLGDKIQFGISSRGDATITYCGFALYKEYT